MNRIRFIRCREVLPPARAHSADAGIDFYMPSNLKAEDFRFYENCTFQGSEDRRGQIITKIHILPHGRILIPSGIRVLMEPSDSMMMVANKSGISAKHGIIFSSEIIDSPYTGEIHLGIINTSNINAYVVEANNKVLQLIHVPVYLTQLEEISEGQFRNEEPTWGTRGTNGIGSNHKE